MKETEKMTEEKLSILNQIGAEVVAAVKDKPLEFDVTRMVVVKIADGNFRQKSVIGGTVFYLKYLRTGARGTLILGFDPEEIEEYESIELNAKDADRSFPNLGQDIATAFGLGEEDNLDFILDMLVDRKIKEEAELKAALEEEANNAYKNHPLFGAF